MLFLSTQYNAVYILFHAYKDESVVTIDDFDLNVESLDLTVYNIIGIHAIVVMDHRRILPINENRYTRRDDDLRRVIYIIHSDVRSYTYKYRKMRRNPTIRIHVIRFLNETKTIRLLKISRVCV